MQYTLSKRKRKRNIHWYDILLRFSSHHIVDWKKGKSVTRGRRGRHKRGFKGIFNSTVKLRKKSNYRDAYKSGFIVINWDVHLFFFSKH